VQFEPIVGSHAPIFVALADDRYELWCPGRRSRISDLISFVSHANSTAVAVLASADIAPLPYSQVIRTDGGTMRKKRDPESGEQRNQRLATEAQARKDQDAVEAKAMDAAVKDSIRRHGP
jgi:hypothetical protein